MKAAWGFAALLGCGPVGPMGSAGDVTGTETTTMTGTEVSGTGGVVTTGSVTTGSSGDTGVVSGSTFIVEDDEGVSGDCGVYEQDCPEGQKCAPYSNDGGGSWNDAKCVAVMADPAQVGEECFVVGSPASGIDNCAFGSICWGVGVDDTGTCVAQCTGSIEMPICGQGYYCSISQSVVLDLCLVLCDPLAMDCGAGMSCLHDGSGNVFTCVIDASGEEGQVHDPCMFANACDPGLVCVNTAAALECDAEAPGCCEPFCDVTLPSTCTGVGQECEPYWAPGAAPEGYEKIGVCALPQ